MQNKIIGHYRDLDYNYDTEISSANYVLMEVFKINPSAYFDTIHAIITTHLKGMTPLTKLNAILTKIKATKSMADIVDLGMDYKIELYDLVDHNFRILYIDNIRYRDIPLPLLIVEYSLGGFTMGA